MSFYLPILLQKYASNPANKAQDMNNFQIKNLATATLGTDAVNLNQATSLLVGGSTGALPFSLIRGGTTTLGQFTNPSGDDVQFTATSTTGKLIFSDIDGIDFLNSPSTFTRSSGNIITVTQSGNATGIKINGGGDPNAPSLYINSTAGERHFTSTRTGAVNQTQMYMSDATTGGLVMMELVKSNNGAGIDISKSGTGPAIRINDSSTSSSTGLQIDFTGTTNGNPGLQVANSSNGRTAEFFQTRTANPNSSVRLTNNSTAGGINLDVVASGTGRAVQIQNTGASSAESLAITHSAGTSNAVYIENGGTGDSLRVADSVGGATFFRINDAGHVGIQVPTGSLGNNHLLVNGGTNAIGTTQLAVSGSTQPDITLGSVGDIYFGQSAGAGNRPRERMTYSSEGGNSALGRIYHQYYGGSGSGNQKWTWTQPASNNAVMNVCPFLQRVSIGEQQSDYTPQANLEVIPNTTGSVNTVRINRNAVANQAPLSIAGSIGDATFTNAGNLRMLNAQANPIDGIAIDVASATKRGLSFTNGAIDRGAEVSVEDDGIGFQLLRIKNQYPLYTYNNAIALEFGPSVGSMTYFEVPSINIGAQTLNNCLTQQMFNGTTSDAVNMILADNSNPSGRSQFGIYSNVNVDLNMLTDANVSFYSTSDIVQVVGNDWLADPTQARIVFKTTYTGAGSNECGIFGITNLGSSFRINSTDWTYTQSYPIALTGSVINLGTTGTNNPIKITNLATPTNPADAVTKAYVDAIVPSGATSFVLAGATSGNANNQPIINLPAISASNQAVRSTITSVPTSNLPQNSVVDVSRHILSAGQVSVFENTVGAIGVNSTARNGYYYLLSSEASPNNTFMANTPGMDTAPVSYITVTPAGFPLVNIGAFRFLLQGHYNVDVSYRIGTLGNGPGSGGFWNVSCLVGSITNAPTTLYDGCITFYPSTLSRINATGQNNLHGRINFKLRFDGASNECLTFGQLSTFGAPVWDGYTLTLGDFMVSFTYLGRIYS